MTTRDGLYKAAMFGVTLLIAQSVGAQAVGPLRQPFKAGEVYRYRVRVVYNTSQDQRFEFNLILNEQTIKVNPDGTAVIHSYLTQPQMQANGADVGIPKEARLAMIPEINAVHTPQGRILTGTLLRKGVPTDDPIQRVGLVAQMLSPLLPDQRIQVGTTWKTELGLSSSLADKSQLPQAKITLAGATREQGRSAYSLQIQAAVSFDNPSTNYSAYGMVDARTGRYLHLNASLTGGALHDGNASLTLDALPTILPRKGKRPPAASPSL